MSFALAEILMIKQRTLKNMIRASGVGLHSGQKVHLALHPADNDTGIVFRRTDLHPVVEIEARAENVGETQLSTTLVKGDVRVSTVEHLLAALAGLGVDNARIDVSSPEIPIMDGSAAPFVFLLQCAGLREQKGAKKFVRVKKDVTFKKDGKTVTFMPFNGFKLNFDIDYDHPVFKSQATSASVDFSTDVFVRDVSRARTFGFMHEYDYLKSMGLVRGGSLSSAIVVDKDEILNEGGLRYHDEFVKHKILDAIGDLYLLGNSLICQFDAYKSGHGINNESLRELIARTDAWEYVTFEDNPDAVPINYSLLD